MNSSDQSSDNTTSTTGGMGIVVGQLIKSSGSSLLNIKKTKYRWMADSVDEVRRWMIAIQKAVQTLPGLQSLIGK